MNQKNRLMKFDHYSIRPLTELDLVAYFQLIDHNRKRLEDVFTKTAQETRTLMSTKIFLDISLKRHKDKSYYPYFIVDDSNDNLIGFMDLKNIDWNIPKAELGLFTDKDNTGKGITSKALNLFCDYCFEEFQFQKLFLRTQPTNLAMRKVAGKCGFEEEGIIRRDYKTSSGKVIDLVYYGKLKP